MKAMGEEVWSRFRFDASLAEGPTRLSRASQVLLDTEGRTATRLHGPLTGALALPLAQAGFYEPKAGKAEERRLRRLERARGSYSIFLAEW
jgi:hypothetical protein